MEIIVIGGQPKEDLIRYLTNNISMGLDNSLKRFINKEDTNIDRKEDFSYLCFPERNDSDEYELPKHPQSLLERMIHHTKDCIKNNKSLYVITFSDHVLNGVRVAIRESSKEVIAECHQLHDGGAVTICPIKEDGSMDIWEEDVFDVYDTSLDRLIF